MIFGHRWVSGYGTTDDGTWLAGLQELTVDQVAHGLEVTLKEDREWPPTLSQFRQSCIGRTSGLTHNTAAYREAPRSRRLERKPNKDIAREAMRKARELLK